MINREKLEKLNAREQQVFAERNPKSKAAFENADHLFGKVPMTIASGTSMETNTLTLP
jgi:glutamate-1-semialdehyde 2,1-aminomutase